MRWRLLVGHALSGTATWLPWPLLLVEFAERQPDRVAVVSSLRYVPFVVLSWGAGRLADHLGRGRLVRWSVGLRFVLLGLSSLLLSQDRLIAATAAAMAAIVACTPAYPALVASLPGIPGGMRVTAALVTVEVTTWAAGPAMGGILLSTGLHSLLLIAPPVLCAAGLVAFAGVSLPSGGLEQPDSMAPLRLLGSSPPARAAVLVAVTVNLALGMVQTLSVTLSGSLWRGAISDRAIYGYLTAALGVGTVLGGWLIARDARRARDGMLRNAAAAGVLMGAMALISPWWVVVPIALGLGAAALACEADAVRVLQTVAPPASGGTVLGFVDSAIVGALALGSLVAGLPRGRLQLLVAAGATLTVTVAMRRTAGRT